MKEVNKLCIIGIQNIAVKFLSTLYYTIIIQFYDPL